MKIRSKHTSLVSFILISALLCFVQCVESNKDNKKASSDNPPLDIAQKEKQLLQEVYGENAVNVRINFCTKLNLYGSKGEVLFFELEDMNPDFMNWTGLIYVIADTNYSILSTTFGYNYAIRRIIPEENEFIIITEITNKNNGFHHFYGMENGKVKDFLDAGSDRQTIGRISMDEQFIPNILNLSFTDINHDLIPDALFEGEVENIKSGLNKDFSISFVFDTSKQLFAYHEIKQGGSDTLYFQNIDMYAGTDDLVAGMEDLKIEIRGDSAYGIYNEYMAEKDSREGTFRGLIQGNVINGEYSYYQEGELHTSPIKIEIYKDKALANYEGYYTQEIRRVEKFFK